MADVIQATYADLKTVKTRGVCQIVLEMPIEGMAEAFSLLGAPVPGNEVWVAVARLRSPEVAPAPRAVTIQTNYAQQAGILCNEGGFIRYAELQGYAPTSEGAADFVRYECGVKSRAQIDGSADAMAKFRALRADYDLWLRDFAVDAA